MRSDFSGEVPLSPGELPLVGADSTGGQARADSSTRLGAVTEKLTDKLFKNRYVEDSGHPHIEIANQDVCRDKCSGKYCNYFCPAGVYEWDEEKQQTIVSFGNCIECGACAIGCPYDNILCQTPRGGYGVQFQLG